MVSATDREEQMKFRTFIKVVAVILVLTLLGLVAFAYLGDLSPRQVDILEPVSIDVD